MSAEQVRGRAGMEAGVSERRRLGGKKHEVFFRRGFPSSAYVTGLPLGSPALF